MVKIIGLLIGLIKTIMNVRRMVLWLRDNPMAMTSMMTMGVILGGIVLLYYG